MSIAVLPKLGFTLASGRPVSVPRPDARPAESPAATIHVQCERDIVDAVCTARERRCAVRPIGGKGSKNDCYGTDGLCLDFGGYGGVLAFDGRTVTVQAGMKMGRLNEFLRRRGAIVPTCGEWQGATVAGSLATGSHGGSSRHGIHPTSVLAVRLITADGRALNVGRDSPYFDHAVVSMGMLGVISTVTFACEPAFDLELETRVIPFDRFLRDHAALDAANEFLASVWFPAARRVLTFAANRVASKPHNGPRMQRFSVTTFVLDALSRYFDINLVTDDRLAHCFVDEADLVICPIEDVSPKMHALRALSRDWRATEPAVPAGSAADALASLDRVLRTHRHAMLNAVGLRTSAADSFSLSPCFGRRMFWIDLFLARGSGGAMDDVAAALEGFGARCHWGKFVGLGAAHLCRQYPRLAEFRRVREALDPDRLFANAYTRRIEV
jgi:L-gulonolactone oxidase